MFTYQKKWKGGLTLFNLDIGCGEKKLENFIGIDLNLNPKIDVRASASMLPIKASSVDIVFSRRCIQHVKNDKKVICEIKRVLKSKGQALCVFASWRGFLFYHTFKWWHKKHHYSIFHFYTKQKLERMFRQVGFKTCIVFAVNTSRCFGKDLVVYAEEGDLEK